MRKTDRASNPSSNRQCEESADRPTYGMTEFTLVWPGALKKINSVIFYLDNPIPRNWFPHFLPVHLRLFNQEERTPTAALGAAKIIVLESVNSSPRGQSSTKFMAIPTRPLRQTLKFSSCLSYNPLSPWDVLSYLWLNQWRTLRPGGQSIWLQGR